MTITIPIKHIVDIFNLDSKDDIKEQLKEIYYDISTEIKDDNIVNSIDDFHTFQKSNYEVQSLNKTMSGYQTLAYYYVRWAIAIPEMLPQLQLPFDKEYDLAKKIVK
jgi:hypothetical protein